MFFRREKESFLERDGREKSLFYNGKIRKEVESLLNDEKRNGVAIYTSYDLVRLQRIESWMSHAEDNCWGQFVMDPDLKIAYDRFCCQRIEYKNKEKQRKELELIRKSKNLNIEISNIIVKLIEKEKIHGTAIYNYGSRSQFREVASIIEGAKYDCGEFFVMDPDLKIAYDRFKIQCVEYDNEEKRKKEEEYKSKLAETRKWEQERVKAEEERQHRVSLEREMQEKQNLVIQECQSLLNSANYTDVTLNLRQSYGYGSVLMFGYLYGIIAAKKDGYDYTVSFETKNQLPYESGLSLLKVLTDILTQVDLSCFERRNSDIKEMLIKQGLPLRSEQECFEIIDDSLAITIKCCEQDVLLKFFTDKTQKVPLEFDTMDGHQFEHFCAELLKKNGYEKLNVTRGSGDQGIDIIAFRDGIKYGIQCKCYSSDIGNKAVQEVFAGKTFYECHIGVVLTNQHFTKSAIELAKKNGIILWDRKKLLELIEKANYYN